MDYCIYHSKDLDGLTSGAVIYAHQKGFGEECKLFGYDYGEKLDTRKFKGKSTVMIDVSMPMDRMETLGNGTMEFIWVDHHLSAYNDLKTYCEEKKYDLISNKINSLIECIEVREMNLIYYYSPKIAACEIAILLFAKKLKESSRQLVKILGQYDTWRNNKEKQFTTDKDWNDQVLPIQWAMRQYNSPEKIYKIFDKLDNWNVSDSDVSFSSLLEIGRSILSYQKKQYEYQCSKNSFEFDFIFGEKTYKVLALNSGGFNSMAFEGFYWPEVHDIMMPFQYNGKTGLWVFSMYATKEEVDILSIAKSFGGGGHKQACGFQMEPENVIINKGCIEFGSNIILDITSLPESFEKFNQAEIQNMFKKFYNTPLNLEDSTKEHYLSDKSLMSLEKSNGVPKAKNKKTVAKKSIKKSK